MPLPRTAMEDVRDAHATRTRVEALRTAVNGVVEGGVMTARQLQLTRQRKQDRLRGNPEDESQDPADYADDF